MVNRIIIVGAVIAAMLLWLGPFSVHNWAVIGFVLVVLFPLAVVLSVKRISLGEPFGTHALAGSDAKIAFLQTDPLPAGDAT
jgi:hypothetical protein